MVIAEIQGRALEETQDAAEVGSTPRGEPYGIAALNRKRLPLSRRDTTARFLCQLTGSVSQLLVSIATVTSVLRARTISVVLFVVFNLFFI